jgi:hypothetical protein
METAAVAVDQKLEDPIKGFMSACDTYDACDSANSNRRVNNISNSPAVVLGDDCGKEMTFPTFKLVPCHNCGEYLDIVILWYQTCSYPCMKSWCTGTWAIRRKQTKQCVD